MRSIEGIEAGVSHVADVARLSGSVTTDARRTPSSRPHRGESGVEPVSGTRPTARRSSADCSDAGQARRRSGTSDRLRREDSAPHSPAHERKVDLGELLGELSRERLEGHEEELKASRSREEGPPMAWPRVHRKERPTREGQGQCGLWDDLERGDGAGRPARSPSASSIRALMHRATPRPWPRTAGTRHVTVSNDQPSRAVPRRATARQASAASRDQSAARRRGPATRRAHLSRTVYPARGGARCARPRALRYCRGSRRKPQSWLSAEVLEEFTVWLSRLRRQAIVWDMASGIVCSRCSGESCLSPVVLKGGALRGDD